MKSLLAGLALLAGCASPTQTADGLNRQIHQKTAVILQAAGSAQTHISRADDQVAAAATQPANPPLTNVLLSGARTHLSAARQDLDQITPAAAGIDTHADAAAKTTAAVQKKLDSERDHWLGYKTRMALLALALLSIPSAIAVFILRTNGAAPIIAAAGTIAGWIFGHIFKPAGMLLFHTVTLGAGKLADLVNRHYDAQQPANVNVEIQDLASHDRV